MKYVVYKITARNVDDLYEEYKEWIDTRNQRKGFKTTIVSTNLV